MDASSITSFALVIMETLIGMVANGFIVLMGCINWYKSRKLSPTDLILTCLSLTRLAWLGIVILNVIMLSFFLHTFALKHFFFLFYAVWFFTYTVSLFFATWLSIFYFVKITIFSHPILLQVKQRFSGLVSWLLLGSVAFSVFMTMTMAIIAVLSSAFTICDPVKLHLNKSYNSEVKVPHLCWQLLIAGIAPGFILSVIFLSFTVLLIISLWKHIRHLRHNGISTKDINTSVHLAAIKVLVSFVILYLSSFVTINLQPLLFQISNDSLSWTNGIFQFMSAVYPSGHAVILILINPKLKQAWVRMIHHLKCHVSEAPS